MKSEPKPSPKRLLSMRIPEAAAERVDRLCKEFGVAQIVVVRAMLTVATAHHAEIKAKIDQYKAAEDML